MAELKVIDEREVLGKDFRVYGTAENPLFLAKDVAIWIEYGQSNGKYKISQMLSTVDDDEKGIYNVDTLGGSQDVWFLTEDGLYEVLMQSRKPIAKQFKKEVKIILKSIRQHGAYMTPEVIEKTLTNPDFIIQLATQLKDEMAKRELAEKQLQEQQPKVALANRLFECSGSKNIGEVAKLFNERLTKQKAIGRTQLFEILRNERVLIQDGAEKNQPQQRYIDAGYFILQPATWDNGYGELKFSSTSKVTPKGIEWLWKFLIKRNYINIDTDIQELSAV